MYIGTFDILYSVIMNHAYMQICSHCLGFVYGDLIERSLDEFKSRWNTHTIRHNRLAGCPSGVPEDLYNLPEINGSYIIQ